MKYKGEEVYIDNINMLERIPVDSVEFFEENNTKLAKKNKGKVYHLRIHSNKNVIKVLWSNSKEFCLYLMQVILNEPKDFYYKMKKYLEGKTIKYYLYLDDYCF